jgi:hypothetical protein
LIEAKARRFDKRSENEGIAGAVDEVVGIESGDGGAEVVEGAFDVAAFVPDELVVVAEDDGDGVGEEDEEER